MKYATLLLALVLYVGGCATTNPEPERHSFAFTYEGDPYEIISVVVPTGGGGNYLALYEGNRFLIRAKDRDQDGRIDTVLVGDITLETANRIYAAGIAEAQRQGKYRETISSRVYELIQAGHTYLIQTYVVDAGRSYNKFILYDTAIGQETVFVDAEGDGILDSVASGDADLDASQPVYEMVLQEGIRDGRITRIDDRYTVLPKPEGRWSLLFRSTDARPVSHLLLETR